VELNNHTMGSSFTIKAKKCACFLNSLSYDYGEFFLIGGFISNQIPSHYQYAHVALNQTNG